jgi:sugar phosphate isomerase/epimerase
MLTRREFLIAAPAAAGMAAAAMPRGPFGGKLCLFSKHLPQLDYPRLARAVRGLGFDGVDLTVRKGGHVAPERAAEDLPRAHAAIRAENLQLPMITTELLAASDAAAAPILSTAGRLGVQFFKAGYYRYAFTDVRRELETAGEKMRGLVELAKTHGLQLGYHNHAGYLGAPVWDIARVLDRLDPKWAGYYFDPCHATSEGGVAGWKIALMLAAPRVKMVAIKDFFWEKGPKGWQTRMCPLGEGMVDWKGCWSILAAAGFAGPVSLHLEYEIPGQGAKLEENTLGAAERDLAFLRARIREAYDGPAAPVPGAGR